MMSKKTMVVYRLNDRLKTPTFDELVKGKIRGRRKAPLRDFISFKTHEKVFLKEWRQINNPNYTKLLTLPINFPRFVAKRFYDRG